MSPGKQSSKSIRIGATSDGLLSFSAVACSTFSCSVETDIRQKDEKSSKKKTNKTEHRMEKRGKDKVKSKPQSKSKSTRKSQMSKPKP
ncbi:hypothetical protein Tco_0614625 [Tanacetum coccineum]